MTHTAPCCTVRTSSWLACSAATLLIAAAGFGIGYATGHENAEAAPSHDAQVHSTSLVQDSPMDQIKDRVRGELNNIGNQDGGVQDGGQDEIDPEMQAWMDANKLGKHHEMLNKLIGTYKADMTMYMAPGAPPEKYTGTMVNTWVLDGRYVRSEFTSDFAGMEFKGIGYTGYSNADKQMQGIWMDSTGTAIEYMQGTVDLESGVANMSSTSTNPVTGEKMQIKEVFKIHGPDKHSMTRAMVIPGMGEVPQMEIVYTKMK